MDTRQEYTKEFEYFGFPKINPIKVKIKKCSVIVEKMNLDAANELIKSNIICSKRRKFNENVNTADFFAFLF